MSYEDMGNAAADIGLKINVTADTSQAEGNMTSLAGKTEFLHSKYIMLAQGIQSMTQAFMMLQMMQERQLIVQDIMENATFRLQTSQDRYNDAVTRYGATSQEAIRAHRELIMAQNQLERAHIRTNMLMEHQFLQVIPMGISMMSGLLSITMALGGAEALRGGVARAVIFGAMAATMGLTAYTAMQGMQGTKTMHAGGVVPQTGFYYLEGGETVNPNRGAMQGRGGDTFMVSILGYPGLDANALYQDIYDRNERLKRTRVPQFERNY